MQEIKDVDVTIGTDQGQKKRLKILLSVYACEPGRGSEQGIGWFMVKELSKHHEVWALTTAEYQEPIEKEIAKNPMPNVHWVYYDLPRWMVFWHDEEEGRRVHYYMWQIGVYSKIAKLHQEVQFDLANHITYGSYWRPSAVSRLPIPFIWGPIGGGESAPQAIYNTLNWKGIIYERIRDTIRWVSHHFDPLVHRTARNATIALATTRETEAKLRELGVNDIRLMLAIALSKQEIAKLNEVPYRADHESPKFRIISIGRLLGWKGYHFGIKAFAELVKEVPDCEYWIIGEGSQENALKELAEELGVADKVLFTGKIPRAEVLQRLSESDILLHPSMHDSGGWVCLEAMATGRPVVCLDLGGPGAIVTDETGIRVSVETPERALLELTEALKLLANDPDLVRKFGEASKKLVREVYDWEDKAVQMSAIYRELVKK